MNKNSNSKNSLKKRRRRKPCALCLKGVEQIDYKRIDILQRYLNANKKIVSRRVTGNCSRHQARVTNAIKRARIVALLPFVSN